MLLTTPIKIGSLELKNRMVMAPMATHLGCEDGTSTERQKEYYEERAAGGAGMITIESCFVNLGGRGGIRRLGLYKDSQIAGMKEIADAVHKHGAKVCCQLHHGGPQCKSAILGEFPLSASSSYYQKGVIDPPRSVRKEEIAQITDDYAAAAIRAGKAGYDAILLHYGHGYLAHSFMSPLTNQRKDEYGGSLENRMRFPLEVVAAIRKSMGKDFPLFVRLGAEDGLEGGIVLSESLQMANMLEAAGVDCITVTAGLHLVMEMMIQPMSLPPGYLVPYAEAMKGVLKIPVGTVGRINNPELAEDVLQKGKADLIYLGRPLIADPFFPQKVIENRSHEIRRCIACNQGCHDNLLHNETITCLVNPRVGREKELQVESATKRKNVLVIGGGPAGMEAAYIAAQRGHQVSLYEKEDVLGGDLFLAGKPPHKEEISNLVLTMEQQLADLGVQVHIGQALSADDLPPLSPEAVIIATGAITSVPPIDGVKQPHVLSAQTALRDPDKIRGNAVIIGGGSTGCEVAELLADKGCRVSIVEMLPDVAQDMESNRRKILLEVLSETGVRILVNAKVTGITDTTVLLDWREDTPSLPADYVILATGIRPKNDFVQLEERLGVPVYYAGSCGKPGAGIDAIREGFEVGRVV